MTKNITILYLCILLNVSCLLAKEPIALKNLTFGSDLEKESFSLLLDNPEARFQIISTVNPTITKLDILAMKCQLYNIYEQLEQEKIRNKNRFSAVKKIYSTVHKELLDTFMRYSYFDQIFENGAYNCATATALFALTFDYFNISYRIVEHRKHVFILVKNGKDDILIETTDAQHGVVLMNKKALVANWHTLGVISKEEKRQFSAHQLYEKYFNQDKVMIGYQELVSDLYVNAALFEQAHGNDMIADQLMEKSKYLYHSRDQKFSQMITLKYLVLEVNILEPNTLEPLFDLMKNEDYRELCEDELIGYYETAIRYLLLENNDYTAYQNLTFYLITKSKEQGDENLIGEFERVSNYYFDFIAAN